MSQGTECRLCGGVAEPLFRQTVLGKHDVQYFRCKNCELIESEKPYWLAEAYSSAICAADTGAIRRNLLTADFSCAIAWAMGIDPKQACLDYGGGHGVFVRMMRDRGFNFRLFDRYADNSFARGFEGNPQDSYQLITAFEVLEHLEDVRGVLTGIFETSPQALLASTQLYYQHDPNWWFYTPSTGQHIAFFSPATMRFVGSQFGYATAFSRAYTLFLRKDSLMSGWRSKLVNWLVENSKGDRNRVLTKTIGRWMSRYPSLTDSDSHAMGLGRR